MQANSSRQLNVVVLDEWLPYPINNGKKLRSFHLIAPLARQHRITYVCPRGRDRQSDLQYAEQLLEEGIEVQWVDRPVPPNSGLLFAPRLAANLLSAAPYSVQRHASRKMRDAVRQIALQRTVDLCHVEWTPYFRNLPKDLSVPVVINAHNIESLIWQRYYEEATQSAKAWYIRKQWKKFEAFERTAFALADCVVTTTENDANLARTTFNARNVQVIENGVDLDRFQYHFEGRDPYNLLFLGSLDWRPNQDAVQILLKTIFPEIQQAEPQARLTIVGLNPPTWLTEKVAQMPGVQLEGNVPDVKPYFEKAGALVVPLRVGGGSRIKILEAMASGCPVIATSIGAEGLSIVPGKHYLCSDDFNDFATTAVSAMRGHSQLREMTAVANQVVRQQYGWKQLSQSLEHVWQMQVASRAGAPA